jgi:hypothetical protein
VVIGRETANYATAREQRQEFAQQVLQPRQESYAERLYQLVHVTMLDAPGWTIDFTLRNDKDQLRQSEVAKNRVEASQGILTVNQVLAELGLEEREDELGGMLLVEAIGGTGGSSGAGTIGGNDVSSVIDEGALAALVDGEIDEQVAAEYGYDLVDRPDLAGPTSGDN